MNPVWSPTARADPLAPRERQPPQTSTPSGAAADPDPQPGVSVAASAPPDSLSPAIDAAWGWPLVALALLALLLQRSWIRNLVGRSVCWRMGVRVGHWVWLDDTPRRVQRIGWTALWTLDGEHTRRTPLRWFLDRPLVVDRNKWPALVVLVRAPQGMAADAVADRLRKAAATAAYVAPGEAPTVAPDPVTPMLWRVSARLLTPDARDAFGGVLARSLRG